MIESGELKELVAMSSVGKVKHIEIGGEPYADRHYMTTLDDGVDVWLIHYHSADGDKYLHCHPFEARLVIVRGGMIHAIEDPVTGEIYHEDRKPPPLLSFSTIRRILDTRGDGIVQMMDALGYVARIKCTTWHRIAEIEPDTWSLMLVDPGRVPMWFFKDDEGCVIPQKASAREWWL